MERFLSLLDTEPATDANAKTLARFQPQNPRAAASMRLGDTQQERSAELHKASSACDTLRIMALLEAGVDIDASNEYGQTAIFLAAYYDAAEAVKLLAWSGADVDRPANGGTSPWMCAAVNGFKGVLEVLSEAGAKTNNLSEQIDFGISTPKLNWLIPADSELAGAGSCLVDFGFPEGFLKQLERLFESLPVAPSTKSSSSDRSYYCDSEGWVRRAFQDALGEIAELGEAPGKVTMPHMRFFALL
ncbi:unnamed protein product [Durusdinium trenchii]|uniref:Uncharacterized protein n=1 Tax=Durusdinium trenchii TaxID=1381693 RepID=A0ABP0NSY7_9DINO